MEEQLLDYRQITQLQCRQAIQNVQKKLNSYNLKFITNRFDINQLGYTQAPEGNLIAFWIEGNATESILNSNQLMLSLSTQIINSCSQDKIIAVDFAPRYTGWVMRFGTVDGMIKMFEQQDPPDCGDNWGTNCVT
ncbi:hypothetical protein NON20_25555 (plasmid) [Synechocystis sp. B12]|nr:hypothetical protein NON20_25555 [Synechocystis sp. B12]